LRKERAQHALIIGKSPGRQVTSSHVKSCEACTDHWEEPRTLSTAHLRVEPHDELPPASSDDGRAPQREARASSADGAGCAHAAQERTAPTSEGAHAALAACIRKHDQRERMDGWRSASALRRARAVGRMGGRTWRCASAPWKRAYGSARREMSASSERALTPSRTAQPR
jgi:hypothetical protein